VNTGAFHEALNMAGLWKLPVVYIIENNRYGMGTALERARKDSLPTLLEVRTYRFMGHSMSDAVSGTYRTKAELEEWQKRDPIVLLRMHMQEQGELTDESLQKLDEEIKAQVQDAWDFADQSPEPPPEALWEDVLVDTTTD
jgi:pyruvate dehydrogenase E1 component alpha subunit